MATLSPGYYAEMDHSQAPLLDAVGEYHELGRYGFTPPGHRQGRVVGRIAAEQITPYPPGIPVVVPGERIDQEVVDYLLSGLEAGMVLPDPADPKLETFRVKAG